MNARKEFATQRQEISDALGKVAEAVTNAGDSVTTEGEVGLDHLKRLMVAAGFIKKARQILLHKGPPPTFIRQLEDLQEAARLIAIQAAVMAKVRGQVLIVTPSTAATLDALARAETSADGVKRALETALDAEQKALPTS